jgi:FKBP-type peptidyl-prolyl cis-trans isomerase FklB
MKKFLTGFLFVLLLYGVSRAEEKPLLTDENGRINYSVGYQIGGDFKRQEVELNSEALVQGIKDSLEETQPLMSEEEMRSTLIDLKKKIVAAEEDIRKTRGEKHRAEGRKFLAENGKKEGVVTLPSGMQYLVLQEGTGRKPTLEDTVTVNYRGTKIDGIEFDSSYKDGKPVTFPLKSVIPGWQEALNMMHAGAKWRIFLPPKLAFGDKGPLEDQTVIYEIELLSVESAE